MAVSYKRLFHMLADRNMTVAELQKEAGYNADVSTRLRRDKNISLGSLEKICHVLNCKPDDILEFVPETIPTECPSNISP